MTAQERMNRLEIMRLRSVIRILNGERHSLIVDAYENGAAWARENPNADEFTLRAARDYANNVLNATEE